MRFNCGLVQDIAAVLQADKDDVQPFDDAPNYQVGTGDRAAGTVVWQRDPEQTVKLSHTVAHRREVGLGKDNPAASLEATVSNCSMCCCIHA